MTPRQAALLPLLLAAATAAQPAAENDADLPAEGPIALRLLVQPEPDADDPAPVSAEAPAPAKPAFGIEGTQWLTFGLAVGDDFNESTDFNAHAAWSRFLADDIELAAELAVWYFDQEGENAYGINPNMIFRWHLIRRERWTFYGDAGIGVLFSTDSVPDRGSDFNLMPRAGVGFTYGFTEDTRLQLGLRWHHISNARITGDASNPARDGPLVYVGLIRRF